MKKLISIVLFALVTAGVLAGCRRSGPAIDSKQLDEKQTSDLAALGADKFGIKWEGRPVGAGERGLMAVTDGVTTLTTRAGARIFILHNRKEFPPSAETEFKGSDEELKSIGMRLLQAAGAKADEVANVEVLQQFTQSGEVQTGGKETKVLPPQKSQRTLMVSRRVAGVDVVSSRLLLNVDSAGRAVFMELAWPDISSEVLDRAARYKKLAESQYPAPRVEGAEVEAVQAVVLHSPAVGFYNDQTAAIRVIYRPTAKQVGQKAVRYV